jgi:two-component system sensor histidine kinase ComP
MKKNFLIIIMLVCLVASQFWFLFITFNYAYYGVQIDKNTQDQWIITGFDEGVSKLTLGLQKGDILLKVDGKDPTEQNSIIYFHEIEQVNAVTILRDGIEREIIIKHSARLSVDYISLFGELFSFCIACLIYLKIPKSKSSQLLILVFILMGIICMSIPASGRGDMWAKILLQAPLTALPIVFIHFLLYFFYEKSGIRLSHKAIYWGYGLIAFRLFAAFFSFTPLYSFDLYSINKLGDILLFLIGLLFNLFIFTYIYIKYRKTNLAVKSIIKFLCFAFFMFCTPLAILSFIPLILFQKPIIEPIYTCFFILLFPLSFTYMLVTEQLFDVQIIVRRILYTTLISMIPSLFIVILQGFIFISATSIQNLLFSFLIIVTIISFLLYVLEYFSSKLDAIIFPRKYQLQNALKKIAKNLRAIKSFRELKEIILVDIVNILQVYGGVIVFKYQNSMETISEGSINLTEVEQSLIKGALDDLTYSVFIINQNEEYSSYLITTKKKNNTLLGLEEAEWLNLIISYLAVSLENLYLIRKLTMRLHELASQIPNEQSGQDFVWLRKSLFELQERERFRIATDLHDTTMQDILLIKKRLITYMEHGEDRQQLLGIIKHLELVNEGLRQSCFELNPYLLQRIGLVKTIEAAIELEMGANEFEIKFYVEGAEAIESLALEVKKHIFRIIQEMIQNAKKHSMATEISLKLSVIEGYTCLFYMDNGVGMDIAALQNADNLRIITSSGLGLDQMRNRIIYLNGHLDIESKMNQGVQITVRIPNLQTLGDLI